jgi:hypothetical protein
MHVIDWSELQPQPANLQAARERLRAALPLRSGCRLLVEIILRAYPWTGRPDRVACYHPSQTYEPDQKLALFIPAPRKAHPGIWLLTHVKDVQLVENPVQGPFQVLTLEIHGKQIQMAAGIPGASYPEPDISTYTTEEFSWLVDWVLETYAATLQATFRRLVQNGAIRGRLVGDTFLPEPVTAISTELLQPCFAGILPSRPWISLEEVYRGLPELSSLERETVLGLLRAALSESPYRSLGGDLWTTSELFRQLDRPVPLGVPGSPLRSEAFTWTKQDEQDLAGYDGRFIPAEARRLLAELGFAERHSGPDASPWRPLNEAVRLPALSYLHVAQAYFPVRSVMGAFAPDVRLVFLQFLHGDHEPFLLDREQGLLKAVYPDKLRTRVLEADIPAGTSLWMEYQGGKQYRIAPRPLPFKRRVPCKLAYVEQEQLHIAHAYISMKDEGNPSLFKADISFGEIESLFAGSCRANQSLHAAIIYAIQEICASDPDHRAHETDILNTVFLTRLCSPMAVSLLLYTQPCFEVLGGGYFRYKPMSEPIVNTRKRTNRLSQLWDGLLAEPVAPRPVSKKRMNAGARAEMSYASEPFFASERQLLSPFNMPETETETSVTARSYAVVEEDELNQMTLYEEEQREPVLPGGDEPTLFLSDSVKETRTESSGRRDSFEALFDGRVDSEPAEPPSLSVDEAGSGRTTFPDVSVESAHVESLSFSSPFRWDPKPAWINPPSQPQPPVSNLVDPRQFVCRPRIPIRPLHKQPFYRRLFFYLCRWLGGSPGKTI